MLSNLRALTEFHRDEALEILTCGTVYALVYEYYETSKDITDVVEIKYGLKLNTYIQLLLDSYNWTWMKENGDFGDHVFHMQLIGKELYDVVYPLIDKM